MLIKRKQLSRRKIVGGIMLGNLFNKTKGVLYNTSKMLLPRATSIGKMTALKALQTAKIQVTPEAVFYLARDCMKKGKSAVKKKLKSHSRQKANTLGVDEELNPHARGLINSLSQKTLFGVRLTAQRSFFSHFFSPYSFYLLTLLS